MIEITTENILEYHKKYYDMQNTYFVCEQCKQKIKKDLHKIYTHYRKKKNLICHKCNLENTFMNKYNVKNISQLQETKQKVA
jgi:hypothetical protein